VTVHFRTSKSIGPFRFTLSKRGLSTSVGAGPLRLSRGADGKVRRTIRVPGMGIYDTSVISPPVKHPHPSDYGSTHAAGVQPQPPTNKRGLIIAGSIVGVVILLLLLGNMDKHGGSDTTPAPTTVTKTVTAPAQSTTVTITQAAPAPRLVETAPPSAPVPLPQSSGVYYENCDAARRDGAAPIMIGEPGYRPGLDRDSDGVACE
jgi:hypothetical protein